MAVSYRHVVSFVFSLTLRKGNDETQRTITIDTVNVNPEDPTTAEKIDAAAEAFRSMILNKFNKFFQPNGWRDSDVAEDEWTTTALDGKLVQRTETGLFDDEE